MPLVYSFIDFLDPEFIASTSFIRRLLYAWMSIAGVRFRYYLAFALGEFISTVKMESGLNRDEIYVIHKIRILKFSRKSLRFKFFVRN
jgi:hypothetical protein